MRNLFPILLLSTTVSSFSLPQIPTSPIGQSRKITQSKTRSIQSTQLSMSLLTRGGSLLTTALVNPQNPWGVPALTAVASLVILPLTQVRQAYSFSVGYGASVAAMGAALLYAFPSAPAVPTYLAYALIFYGIRLSSHLLVRELTVPSIAARLAAMDKSSRLKRIPFSVSVAMFYAFMTSPVMYALRNPNPGFVLPELARAGMIMAWVGAIVEGVSDAQKYIVKQKRSSSEEDDTFVGPTGGLYSLCRHPNYFGEVLFWTGVFLSGLPSFGKSIVAYGCSGAGLYGIVGIMRSATKRLDESQMKKYTGQQKYDQWVTSVKGKLIPFV